MKSPVDQKKRRESPSELKATYFAVTGQISNTALESNTTKNEGKREKEKPYKNKDCKTLTLDSSKLSSSKSFIDTIPITPYGANSVNEQDQGSKDPAKNCKRQSNKWSEEENVGNIHSRSQRHRTIDVDAVLSEHGKEYAEAIKTDLRSTESKSFSHLDLKSPSYRPWLEGQVTPPSRKFYEKRPSSLLNLSGDDKPSINVTEDNYKYKFLDIDAIMADYNSDPLKTAEHKAKGREHSSAEDSRILWHEDSKAKKSFVSNPTPSWEESKSTYQTDYTHKQYSIESKKETPRPTTLSLIKPLNENRKSKVDSPVQQHDKQNKSQDKSFMHSSRRETQNTGNSSHKEKPQDWVFEPTFSSSKVSYIDDDHQNEDKVESSFPDSKQIEQWSPLGPSGIHSVKQKPSSNLKSNLFDEERQGPNKDYHIRKLLDTAQRSTGKGQKSSEKNEVTVARTPSDMLSKISYRSRNEYLDNVSTYKKSSNVMENPGKQSNNLSLGQEEMEKKKEKRGGRRSLPLKNTDDKLKKESISQQKLVEKEKSGIVRGRSKSTLSKNNIEDKSPSSGKSRSHSSHKQRSAHQLLDQLKQCVFRPSSEVKDTDTLVPEAGYPYGTWDASLQSEESFTPGTNDTTVSPTTSSKKQTPQSRLSSQTESTPTNDHHDSMRNPRTSSLDHSSVELDSTDGTEGVLSASASAYADGEAADFSFLDQTSVLDSSALKTRAQLSKRRSRRAPTSKSIRKSKLIVVEEDDNSWMFKDSTGSTTEETRI
nr:PREDICTED: uncharacterized protein KIAA1671-like [Latimeria chalumnae]|eukprot:XP_014345964.1 PREDICTED: uncharacterized protein KIAA1671-like [Latimeria chalumnae]